MLRLCRVFRNELQYPYRTQRRNSCHLPPNPTTKATQLLTREFPNRGPFPTQRRRGPGTECPQVNFAKRIHGDDSIKISRHRIRRSIVCGNRSSGLESCTVHHGIRRHPGRDRAQWRRTYQSWTASWLYLEF